MRLNCGQRSHMAGGGRETKRGPRRFAEIVVAYSTGNGPAESDDRLARDWERRSTDPSHTLILTMPYSFAVTVGRRLRPAWRDRRDCRR